MNSAICALKKKVGRQPFVARTYDWLKGIGRQRKFSRDFDGFVKSSSSMGGRFPVEWNDRYPCLRDNTATTGFDRHYVYHTAWAARVLNALRPVSHVDISSSLFFCGLVSAFLPVEFYDYRPADLRLSGLGTHQGDLMKLPFPDNSVPSLSCMHTVEHIGLGRYGDPMDPDGDLKAIAELKRVLAPGGTLLFVVPVGRSRVQFNAHRIYGLDQVRSYFADLNLKEISVVPDEPHPDGMMKNPSAQFVGTQSYACGCFWFEKPLAL